MIPYIGICQTISTNLTENQLIEIYKGLLQNEELKNILDDIIVLYKESENENNNKKEMINNLKNQIELLKENNLKKDIIIENFENISKLKKTNKFSIGISTGYGFNGKKISPFLGLGVSYNLFNF